MTRDAEHLHGSAPDTRPVALRHMDVINPLDLPEADRLLRHVLPAAYRLAELKRRVLKAETLSAADIDFAALAGK